MNTTNTNVHAARTTRWRPLLLAVLLVAGSNAAFAQQEDEFSRTIDLGASGSFELSNVSGDIQVETADGNELTIRAVKRAHGRRAEELLDRVEIDVSHRGDRVVVETRHRGDSGHGRRRGGVSVHYHVTVPEGTEVIVKSVSGNVTVTGVGGETSAQTVSGSVRVSDLANLVEARAVSGDVDVRRVRSARDIEIASVSGDVTVVDVEAVELQVSSVSGEVLIDGAASERASLESVSGDIRYEGRLASGGRYDFQSHSGDVILRLEGGVGFELEASTFSGDVESDFEMSVRSMGRRGRRLEAVVGDGSARVEATTFSGDVQLRRR